MKETAHVRNSSVSFHPIGLSNRVIKNFNPRHDIYVTDDQTWNMMDLLSIMDKLGHKNVRHVCKDVCSCPNVKVIVFRFSLSEPSATCKYLSLTNIKVKMQGNETIQKITIRKCVPYSS